jgi:hypothetical protein
MIVQSEDGLDILPLPLLRGDASTTLFDRVCDELIYGAQALGFIEGLGFEGTAGFFGRCG